MTDPFKDYTPAKEAAVTINISYELLMSRIAKGKVEAFKHGYAVFIHNDEVERERAEQAERDNAKQED